MDTYVFLLLLILKNPKITTPQVWSNFTNITLDLLTLLSFFPRSNLISVTRFLYTNYEAVPSEYSNPGTNKTVSMFQNDVARIVYSILVTGHS